MQDAQALRSQLSNHIGSQTLYSVPYDTAFCYTEGAKDFFENAGNGAYWLLDILVSERAMLEAVAADGFGIVRLKVSGSKAVLTVDNGHDGSDGDERVCYLNQAIEFTDCPEGEWRFYLELGDLNGWAYLHCLLPSEH